MVETGTNTAMEWAWKLKSEHSIQHIELVVLFRSVPRYRGQDIWIVFIINPRI
jgi:hypothetical protein